MKEYFIKKKCVVCSKKIKHKSKDICCSKCEYLYKIYHQISVLTNNIEKLTKDLKEIQEKQTKIEYFNYQKENNKHEHKKPNTNQ